MLENEWVILLLLRTIGIITEFDCAAIIFLIYVHQTEILHLTAMPFLT